jgi:PRC-barrel domain
MPRGGHPVVRPEATLDGEMQRVQTVELGDARSWPGLDVYDRDGDHIGRATTIYVDGEADRPEFCLVRTGLFGLRSVLIPLAGAFEEGGVLIVDVDKASTKRAPHLRRDEPLSETAEQELYAHYGLDQRPSGRLEPWHAER